MNSPAIHAAAWHGEPPAVWRERWGVPDLRIFASVGSTNDVARALAEAGAPTGAVVLADEQTRGRGRRGRSWVSAPGHSLLVSFVLRPDGPVTGVLPLRVGMAVGRAIEAETGITPGIKWPNDLVLDGRKVGGVLCESASAGGRTAFVIVGIGLNVLQSDDAFPPELHGLATSLAAAAPGSVSMPGLAGHVVSEVSIAAARASDVLSASELQELRHRDVLRGRAITLDGTPVGRAEGVDESGALLVRHDGALRRVLTGTVRPERNP